MHIILILLALLFLFPSSNSEARVDLGVSIGDEGLRIRKGKEKKRKADLYPFIFRIENIFMKLKVQSYLKPVFEYPH
jgi:hypothetical protein